ncbi:DUF2190 family protein [Cohaesibacter intestini]|uniref:DUF2190 family protein n=1 Tax=Cohaesibacter intestini TaxID=2211145 RepID=UPI000DEA5DE9|nr:DUF2190 family protein [Cohaesibacter intestini]
MKNYLSEGNVIDVPAPAGGAKSGDFALIGSLFGCYVTSADEGELVGLERNGKYDVPFTGNAVAVGAKLYWKAADKAFTGAATDNTLVGIAVSASADSKVEIVLVPTVV